jgi:hypothetical protein
LREGARDLDELLGGGREIADDRVGREVRALTGDARESRLGDPLRFAVTHDAESGRFTSQGNVFGDREMRAERQLLVHHGDASAARVERARRFVRRAVEQELTRVGPDCAGEHVHERALAGSVFADERVHLTRLHRKAHPS